MAIKQHQTDNLFKAFGLFIEAYRPYVVSMLIQEAGEHWPDWFVEALYPALRDAWEQGIKAGSTPEALIDFPHLKPFVLKYRDLLKKDFGRNVNKLATWLETIYDIRNKLAHFREINEDEFAESFIQMKNIARCLGMAELEEELVKLQEAEPIHVASQPRASATSPAEIQPWFRAVTPHLDIRQGRLDESIFAANLSEVALGKGREIYTNPVVFFSKTFFTAGLKSISRTVIKGLNGTEDAENRVISLQTGFGGGKTHTLISLFHLCKWGKQAKNSEHVSEVIRYTGLPEFDSANISVFTNKTNDPANGRLAEDGILIQTIWGELAYQLGGKEAYEIIRKNDEQLIAPAGLFDKILEKCKPSLILIDELADYCLKSAARIVGNSTLADQTISFMQELTEAVATVNHSVVVITLPASPQEVGNTPEAQSILSTLQRRVSRVGAEIQPVADEEIYEVIRRRLFEEVGDTAMIERVASRYMELYHEHRTELPANANRMEYKQKIIKSYPFHPELIDIFRIRWGSHHDFQRTRGVLRLLASIISDLWKKQQILPGPNLLIHSGNVDVGSVDAISSQLKRLWGNGYDSVISADVAGSSSNAFKIDSIKTEYGLWNLTQSIASVILTNSFGSEGTNRGISIPEMKLHLLFPDSTNQFNHNSINGALDELESTAYYLYYAQTGGSTKRYWFHTKPNIKILVDQAKEGFNNAHLEAEILRRLRDGTSSRVQMFTVLIDPSGDLPEQTKPTLILLHPQYMATPDYLNGNTLPVIEKLATKRGNTDRIYRNTMLFLICSELGMGKLQADLREHLACQKIISDYSSQLERNQKEELDRRLKESSRQADVSIVKAYSILVKYSAMNGPGHILIQQFQNSINDQINTVIIDTLKQEEWLLESIGSNTMRLHNLLPTPEQALRVKDVYEAFIRFDDKPMITSADAVAKSLVKYCYNGEFCIATGDGTSFTRYFLGEQVPFFDVSDQTYWLLDKILMPKPEIQPGTPEPDVPNVPGDRVGEGETSLPDVPELGAPRVVKSVTVSGRVPLDQYTQVFSSFIMPLAQNNIEIEIRIKGKSTSLKPLSETSQEYKIVKESAQQLGLSFEEEE